MKFGGAAMGDAALGPAFAQDIVYLKRLRSESDRRTRRRAADRQHAEEVGDQVRLRQGLRVSDKPTVEVVEMVLAGLINKEIVSAINKQGAKAAASAARTPTW